MVFENKPKSKVRNSEFASNKNVIDLGRLFSRGRLDAEMIMWSSRSPHQSQCVG